MQVDKKV
jgi:flagellar biosynthesis/type III secretory pathway protein FliH